jgi:hypothetical protein
MAAAKMRHFNSPEEVKRREGQPAGTSKAKEFRHYNHPEEVARRAAAGQAPSAAAVVPPRQQRPAAPLEQWPPPGQPNNAPVDAPAVLVEAAPEVTNDKPDTVPPPAAGPRNVERLRRLEELVYTLVEDIAEARHFRMLLNNQQAVTDSQQDLVNRVRAVEETLDGLTSEDDDDGEALDGADDGQVALELTAGDATPTRDDNDRPEGA